MTTPRLRLAFLGFFIGLGGAVSLSAQQRPADFGTWTVGVGVDRVWRPSELGAVWDFPAARVVWVSTPLGVGEAEAGFRIAEGEPVALSALAGVPEVEILEAFLGWRWRRAVIGPVAAGIGGQLGVERYAFDDGPNDSETELTGAAIVSLGVARGPWRADVEGGVRRVYSEPRAWNPTLGVRASGSGGVPDFVRRALGPPESMLECTMGSTFEGPTLGDRLRQAFGGGAASSDGFHWGFNARGLAVPGTETPVLVLDGVRTEMDVFGTVPWNALPIHSAATPCVRIVQDVAFGLAGLHARTEVHIDTPPPPPGFSLDLSATAANEVGDQGLWRYVAAERRNVDRPLQGMEASVSLASSTASIQAGIGDLFWVMGDPALRSRVRSGYDATSFFAIGVVPWFARARWDSGDRRLRAWWGAAPVDDFRFIPTLGREVPLSVESRGGGVALDLGTVAGGSLSVRSAASRVSLDRRPNTLGIDPSAALDRWSSEAQWGRTDSVGRGWRVGAGVSGREAETGFVRPSESLSWRVTVGGASAEERWSGDVEVAYEAERPHVGGRIRWTAAAGQSGRVAVTGSSTVAGPRVDETLARWTESGLVGAEGLAPCGPSGWTEVVSRQTGIDATWQSVDGVGRRVRTGAFLRRHSGLQIEVAWHRYEAGPALFPADVHLERDRAAWVAGLWMDGHFLPRRGWRVSGRLDVRGSPGGDIAATDVLGRLSRVRASSRAEWAAGSGVSLALAGWFRSGVTWTSFAGLEQATQGRWSESIPTSLRLDLSAAKHFRGGNARLELGLRNLTNTEIRWHPVGLREDLTLFARVRVTPSIR